MFYKFRQNNSDGVFAFDKNDGITVTVIIEADSVYEANNRAEEIGIYFNGCAEGVDCPCCGDRWDPAASYDASETLEVDSKYGQYMKSGWNTCVHYKDGRKEWF